MTIQKKVLIILTFTLIFAGVSGFSNPAGALKPAEAGFFEYAGTVLTAENYSIDSSGNSIEGLEYPTWQYIFLNVQAYQPINYYDLFADDFFIEYTTNGEKYHAEFLYYQDIDKEVDTDYENWNFRQFQIIFDAPLEDDLSNMRFLALDRNGISTDYFDLSTILRIEHDILSGGYADFVQLAEEDSDDESGELSDETETENGLPGSTSDITGLTDKIGDVNVNIVTPNTATENITDTLSTLSGLTGITDNTIPDAPLNSTGNNVTLNVVIGGDSGSGVPVSVPDPSGNTNSSGLDKPASITPTKNDENIITPSNSTQMTDAFREDIEYLEYLGQIETTEGKYISYGNIKAAWAQLGWFKWYTLEKRVRNFVIAADITWESASQTPNWSDSGCGFVFREANSGNFMKASIAMDGHIDFDGESNYRYTGEPRRKYGPYNLYGSYRLTVAAFEDHAVVMIDGEPKLYIRDMKVTGPGNLAYTVMSGTNKTFGTRCEFNNLEVLVLN